MNDIILVLFNSVLSPPSVLSPQSYFVWPGSSIDVQDRPGPHERVLAETPSLWDGPDEPME